MIITLEPFMTSSDVRSVMTTITRAEMANDGRFSIALIEEVADYERLRNTRPDNDL